MRSPGVSIDDLAEAIDAAAGPPKLRLASSNANPKAPPPVLPYRPRQ
jgi:hypothetical protein